MISSKGNDFTVKHSVLPGQIRSRLDGLVASVPVDRSHTYEAQHTSLQLVLKRQARITTTGKLKSQVTTTRYGN